jgi:integrase/recombinase XerD
LFRYASLHVPEHAALIGRVLAIQPKRATTTIVSFLTRSEHDALLAAPDRATWHGRRDHALLVFAAQTGLRVSALTGLAMHDVHLGTGPHAYCRGKGRKDRATPLTAHRHRRPGRLARRQLMSFIEFCEARGAGRITADLVPAWVMPHPADLARQSR